MPTRAPARRGAPSTTTLWRTRGGLRDAAAAAAALPYAAWLGTAASVRGARGDGTRRAPAGARRPATVVFARRRGPRPRGCIRRVARGGRAPGVRGAARTPDALGGKPRDYVAVAPNCSEVFPGTDADAAAALERSALVGAPVLLRGAALGWNWTGWDWSALERRDDIGGRRRTYHMVTRLGFAPPEYNDPRRLRARSRRHVRLRRGAAADALFAMGDVRRRVEALVRPSLDAG